MTGNILQIRVYESIVLMTPVRADESLIVSLSLCYSDHAERVMQGESFTGLAIFGPKGDKEHEVVVRKARTGSLLCIIRITETQVVVQRHKGVEISVENVDNRRAVQVVELTF